MSNTTDNNISERCQISESNGANDRDKWDYNIVPKLVREPTAIYCTPTHQSNDDRNMEPLMFMSVQETLTRIVMQMAWRSNWRVHGIHVMFNTGDKEREEWLDWGNHNIGRDKWNISVCTE